MIKKKVSALIGLLLFISFPSLLPANPIVWVIQDNKATGADEFMAGLKETLPNAVITVLPDSPEGAPLSPPEKFDYILSIGVKAQKAAFSISHASKFSALAGGLTLNGFRSFDLSQEKSIIAQLVALKAILPAIRNVGMVYNGADSHLIDRIKAASKD